MPYVPLRKAVEKLGLHPNTLRRYADQGQIETIRTKAGQRLFNVESYIMGATQSALICYCRVSSNKQKDDLHRQVAYMQSVYPEAEIVQDVGSGLNFNRKGLRSLLDRLMRGDQLEIVVACRDRLARFGFELIEYLAERNGGKIVVLDSSEHCPESELVQDILAIIQIFSCRLHGLRKYGNKIKKDRDLPQGTTEEKS